MALLSGLCALAISDLRDGCAMVDRGGIQSRPEEGGGEQVAPAEHPGSSQPPERVRRGGRHYAQAGNDAALGRPGVVDVRIRLETGGAPGPSDGQWLRSPRPSAREPGPPEFQEVVGGGDQLPLGPAGDKVRGAGSGRRGG